MRPSKEWEWVEVRRGGGERGEGSVERLVNWVGTRNEEIEIIRIDVKVWDEGARVVSDDDEHQEWRWKRPDERDVDPMECCVSIN